MSNYQISGGSIAPKDKAFAIEFENFVNGGMSSATNTGKEMAKAHRYLQQQMFKVVLEYVRQLAINYKADRYDDRNAWAVKLAHHMYEGLIEGDLVYDYDYSNPKSK